MSNPTNTDDIIDSRDVIERIEELEEQDELDQDEQDELISLLGLASEGSDYAADWSYGEALIRDSYFKEYAQDLSEDLGMTTSTPWPYCCIDWDQAARELQMDYSAIDFDGVTYWVR